MALTALALLTLFPSMSSKRGEYNSLLALLICMLIPHTVFGGYVVYRIAQRMNAKFRLSVRITKLHLRQAFEERDAEILGGLPVDNTDVVIRNQCSRQAYYKPTESTPLLR